MRAPLVAGEVAIGRPQPRDRAAEAVGVGALHIEPRLHQRATQRRADPRALDSRRVRRQRGIACRAAALKLYGTNFCAVGINDVAPARAVETGVP